MFYLPSHFKNEDYHFMKIFISKTAPEISQKHSKNGELGVI